MSFKNFIFISLLGFTLSFTLKAAATTQTAPIKKKVLVHYKNQPSLENFSKVSFQKALIENTALSEKKVFNQESITNVNDKKTLWIVNSTLISLTPDEIARLEKNPNVASITAVGRTAHLIKQAPHFEKIFHFSNSYTYGLEKIKLPELNQKYPELQGDGITVGVIDTGIDPNHPDLINKTILFKDFTPARNPTARDDHGHGTHVAGTIAGGSTSGQAIGVAPAAHLFIAKGFDAKGESLDSGLLEALQWMVDPDGNPSTNDTPRVISNSWNIEDQTFANKDPNEEPFCQAIQTLNKMGVAVVFAAGNDGPTASSVLLPGSCPEAITVGATNEGDRITSFSSRGPVKWKSNSFVKPNISAPGESIESANPGGDYETRSGTSMATPHIAGILALLFQAKPTLTLDEAKNYLYTGAKDLGTAGEDNISGFGRADVLKSVDLIKNIQ